MAFRGKRAAATALNTYQATMGFGNKTAIPATIAASVFDGLMGPSDKIDRKPFYKAHDMYKKDVLSTTRRQKRELGANLGASLASSGLNESTVGAYIKNANQARLDQNAQRIISRSRMHLENQLATAEARLKAANNAQDQAYWNNAVNSLLERLAFESGQEETETPASNDILENLPGTDSIVTPTIPKTPKREYPIIPDIDTKRFPNPEDENDVYTQPPVQIQPPGETPAAPEYPITTPSPEEIIPERTPIIPDYPVMPEEYLPEEQLTPKPPQIIPRSTDVPKEVTPSAHAQSVFVATDSEGNLLDSPTEADITGYDNEGHPIYKGWHKYDSGPDGTTPHYAPNQIRPDLTPKTDNLPSFEILNMEYGSDMIGYLRENLGDELLLSLIGA